MLGTRWIGWMFVAAAMQGCVSQPELRGPMAVRNQHPAQLLVAHLDARGADVLPAGDTAVRVGAAYTSLFLIGSTPQSSFVMDGEQLRASLAGRLGLGRGLELGVTVPVVHTTGGFLDDAIIDFHDVFGLPDQDRSPAPRGLFSIDAQQGGQSVWSVARSGLELADVPFEVAWQLRRPGDDRVGLMLRGGVELPTGSADRGYGNGKVDVVVGAFAEYRRGGVGYTANVQHAIAGTRRETRALGFRFADVSSVGVGIELPVRRDLHLLAQAELETSTLRELGPRVASRNQMVVWLGGRWTPSPQWALEFGLGEDVIAKSAPDFTAWLGLEWRIGAGRGW
ncbi:MAG: hypothetical protein CMJ88_15070 [Planctomycetes bacterium]|nr:hypothetical protein [Planctomycetota bacterium]